MKYQVVIGIEIHLELLTKSKMFSTGKTSFNETPNTNITAVDLALPGTLPQINGEAIRKAVQLAHLLHCQIDPLLRFDRKNYYYPDLPKGFQITQDQYPLGQNGYLEILTEEGPKKIKITRLHVEEDTAKQIHQSDCTYLDYNRCGNPLVEIVTDCSSFAGAREVALYLEGIRSLSSHYYLSNAKMEEGSMRCDLNISLNLPGAKLGTKVEVKNMNSISNVEKAIEYEIQRQSALLDNGAAVVQETRRFDDQSGTTVFMRQKTAAVDYKYFPEPNLLPHLLPDSFITDAIAGLGKSYQEEVKDLVALGIKEADAQVVISNLALRTFIKPIGQAQLKVAVNLLIGEVLAILNELKKELSQTAFTAEHLVQVVQALDQETISRRQVKLVLTEMISGGKDLASIIKEHGLAQISDEATLLTICEQIVADFPQALLDIREGRDNAYQFLVGQVFKRTKGQAKPDLAAKLIRQVVAKKL